MGCLFCVGAYYLDFTVYLPMLQAQTHSSILCIIAMDTKGIIHSRQCYFTLSSNFFAPQSSLAKYQSYKTRFAHAKWKRTWVCFCSRLVRRLLCTSLLTHQLYYKRTNYFRTVLDIITLASALLCRQRHFTIAVVSQVFHSHQTKRWNLPISNAWVVYVDQVCVCQLVTW